MQEIVSSGSDFSMRCPRPNAIGSSFFVAANFHLVLGPEYLHVNTWNLHGEGHA